MSRTDHTHPDHTCETCRHEENALRPDHTCPACRAEENALRPDRSGTIYLP